VIHAQQRASEGRGATERGINALSLVFCVAVFSADNDPVVFRLLLMEPNKTTPVHCYESTLLCRNKCQHRFIADALVIGTRLAYG